VNWRELLDLQGSFLSASARSALAGLVRALQTAQELAPANDPGHAACRRLIAELNGSLSGEAPAAPARPELSSPAAVPETGLAGLVRTFASDPAVRAELGAWQHPDEPAALWLQANLALLRLPAALAEQGRNTLLAGAGREVNPSAVTSLFGEPADVFPGLGRAPLQAGLRLDPSGAVDARLGAEPLPPIARRLAGPVTLLLWVSERDPNMHHAVRSVYRFGTIGLAGGQKGKYQRALVDRFARFAAAERGSDASELVLSWVELDEAIHALLHLPIPSSSSWWGRYLTGARETLVPVRERAVAAGKTVHLQTLVGRYADVLSFTDSDADGAAEGNAEPGEVIRCLRVFLRLDGTAHKGRVLYRSR
jgi:hypothetical protein